MFGWFRPDRYYDSIFDIDTEDLKRCGIKGLIVDIDNTIIPWNEIDTPQHLHDWLEKIHAAGFSVCIVTNRNLKRANIVADRLELPVIGRAWKPRKKPFKAALKALCTSKHDTAVIGDQLFTDILGGKRAGMFTILVAPISEKELPTTRTLRQIERILLRNVSKDN